MECIIFLENKKFQECVWSAWILVCKWSPGSAFGVRTFQQKKMWECVGVHWRILECVWSAHSLRTAMHCKRTFQPQGIPSEKPYDVRYKMIFVDFELPVQKTVCQSLRHRKDNSDKFVIYVAWRHQAITWTNVDKSSVRSSDIHLRAITEEPPQPSTTKVSLKITYPVPKFVIKTSRSKSTNRRKCIKKHFSHKHWKKIWLL